MTKQVTERELVLAILMEVTQQNVYSHLALNAVLEKYQYLEKKERAFITRVTEGTLEHMIELDYILNQFSKVKVNKMKPVIRNILRSVQRGSKAGSEKRIRHPAWICKRSAPQCGARSGSGRVSRRGDRTAVCCVFHAGVDFKIVEEDL